MQKKICIIVPCYNEASRLSIENFLRYIKTHKGVFFLFVNDGSTDRTIDALKKIESKGKGKTRILNIEKNVGKAEAVRLGVLDSFRWQHFNFVGYLDADLATPLEEIQRIIEIMKEKKILVVFGSRIKRLGAKVERNPIRHYIGRFLATFISLLLKLPVYDTQCGLKMFKMECVQNVFSREFKTTWLFDCEILARLINKYGHEQIYHLVYELPIQTWMEKGGSKIKIEYFLKIPFELYRIYRTIKKY